MIKMRNKGPVEMATKQLGHSGPDMTYRNYSQIQSETAIEAVNNLFREESTAINPNLDYLGAHPDRKTFLITGENISYG
jgi:hypothetical protein